MLCRSFLDLETNSKCAPLHGEGRWGLKRPCVHWSQHKTFRQLGRDPARAHLSKGKKLVSGSCIRKSETLLGKLSSAPMRVCSGKQRFPVSTLCLCLPQEQGGSGLPPAPCALVFCWWSLDLETYSKRALLWGECGWGLKSHCVHWHHHPNFLQLWRVPARPHLRNGTKLDSGSCIRESETLLWKPSSAPMRVCSGKQRFVVSPLAHCSP